MSHTPIRLFLWACFSIFICTGCVRHTGASSAATPEDLPGTYRVLWSDGTPNDHNFTIENKNGDWYLSDDESGKHLSIMTRDEIEAVFGKEMADKAQCLEYKGSASTLVICAAEPGLKTKVRIDDFVSYSTDFTTKTNHFTFIDYMGIWDMEKLK